MEPTRLDLRGLRCPLPVLRTRKALRALAPDTLLVVDCTDPLAGIDIPHMLRDSSDVLVETTRDGDVMRFTIRRGGPANPPGRDPPAC